MLKDRNILKRLRAGDRDALWAVYEKYKDPLQTIAGAMLRDSCAAEDVLHDVFVAFARNARRLQIKGSLRNYLTACVANKVRDEYRRKHVRTIELDHAESICACSEQPGDGMMADERTRALARALAAIPFEQREVILLHLKGSLKFKEIARIQSTTTSTVHGRYRYGLKKLRVLLNGEFSNGRF